MTNILLLLRKLYLIWSVFTIMTVVVPISILTSSIIHPRHFHASFTEWGAKWIWWNYVTFTKNRIKKLKEPTVIISNHQSVLDILFLPIFFCKEDRKKLKFVVGHVANNFPAIRWAYQFIGDVYVDHYDDKSKKSLVNRAVNELQKGNHVIFFVEQKRTLDPPNLYPFKKGGFLAAYRNKSPILPIVMTNTYKVCSIKYETEPTDLEVFWDEPRKVEDVDDAINDTINFMESKIYK